MDTLLTVLPQLVAHTRLAEWATVVADLLIALVIYYEVEEHRASEFLAGVHEGELYRQRANLYDEYSRASGSTLRERAEAFRAKLWANPALREQCDAQWTYFNRLQYMLRHSLFHRGLLARWFPHVVVSVWVMLVAYMQERQSLKPAPADVYFLVALRLALNRLRKKGFHPITIYSKDKSILVKVTVEELEAMRKDPYGPFR
jgi:hypothetical protein